MRIPWTAKKQISLFFVVLAIAIVAIIFVLSSLSSPSCFDKKKNQEEEDIDCGGPCEACVGNIQNLIIHWNKVFKLKDGKYEATALIDNPNLFAGIPSLKYKFSVYDEKNVLVAVRSGETFINPDEKLLLLESDIDSPARIPKYAFLELEENPKWKRIEKEKPQLVISKKQFSNTEPFPKLIVEIANKSLFGVENIEVAVIFYDENQNAKAVSSSKVNYIGGDSDKEIIFTWPELMADEPNYIEIFTRINMTD